MATLGTIPTATRIFVTLGRNECEDREFWALPSFMMFFTQTLSHMEGGVLKDVRETPKEQMYTVLRKWNAGRPMMRGRAFSDLRPRHHSVWEMKTPDLRIFGWLYRPRVFVAAFAASADDYKKQKGQAPKESYDAARDRVVWLRSMLPLDPPLFVTGDYDALVQI